MKSLPNNNNEDDNDDDKSFKKDQLTRQLIASLRINKTRHKTSSTRRRAIPITEYRPKIMSIAEKINRFRPIFRDLMADLTDSSSVFEHVLELMVIIRKLVSFENNPPLDEVVKGGLVPFSFQILYFGIVREYLREYKNRQDPLKIVALWRNLVFESSWILTNIASGSYEHTISVISYKDEEITSLNAVQTLLMLLHCEPPEIKQQALWNLANITGDNTESRDLVLHTLVPITMQGAKNYFPCLKEDCDNLDKVGESEKISSLKLIYNVYQSVKNNGIISMIRIISWTFSNFFRAKPINMDEDSLEMITDVMKELALTSEDVDVLSDTLWGITYGTESNIPKIFESFLDDKLICKLIDNVINEKDVRNIELPSLRILGNFTRMEYDAVTQQVIDQPEFFKCLSRSMQSDKFSMKKEALYVMSNIAAGTPAQSARLVDIDIASILLLVYSADFHNRNGYSLKKEATWVLSNMLSTKDPKSYEHIIQRQELIKHLFLFTQDVHLEQEIVDAALQPIFENIAKIMPFEEYVQFYERYSKEYCHILVQYPKLMISPQELQRSNTTTTSSTSIQFYNATNPQPE
ncbi:predicted protein [Naegleria gruberi]|uniref:Predicted protein n=1 Tax=Naegleria gruberi TaxID=5762 RepID=D2VGG1_NAEGR|nr:uncharacterized protein NAEGRDRAFT_67964 [Naegleria gruberi]EFC44059.1 predicted protein [Naegleria gruberi]|eukprot:XP_002676803.1 predicted protein [Naegleria gruberi strain NEG-M]